MTDRTTDVTAGISVVSAVAASFAADPLSVVATLLAIIAAGLSIVGQLGKFVRWLRR
jgi:hypothetical protein